MRLVLKKIVSQKMKSFLHTQGVIIILYLELLLCFWCWISQKFFFFCIFGFFFEIRFIARIFIYLAIKKLDPMRYPGGCEKRNDI